jgi:hypothetical protein
VPRRTLHEHGDARRQRIDRPPDRALKAVHQPMVAPAGPTRADAREPGTIVVAVPQRTFAQPAGRWHRHERSR